MGARSSVKNQTPQLQARRLMGGVTRQAIERDFNPGNHTSNTKDPPTLGSATVY